MSQLRLMYSDRLRVEMSLDGTVAIWRYCEDLTPEALNGVTYDVPDPEWPCSGWVLARKLDDPEIRELTRVLEEMEKDL